MINEVTEKQRQRCERLAEERYEALRNTIAHLYGKKFLFELEMNVSDIIRRLRFENTIPYRLRFLRRQYRTKCKVVTSEQWLMEKAFYYVTYSKKEVKYRERSDLRMMRKRSKARQRYNRLAEVILRDLGEKNQKELIWKAEVRALADITNKYKYRNFSWIRGYCSNDRACALHHLRIMYAYARYRHEEMYGTSIHNQINANYRNGMLDYNQANKL